jgi:2-oxoglutarate dehydrogenase E1 component
LGFSFENIAFIERSLQEQKEGKLHLDSSWRSFVQQGPTQEHRQASSIHTESIDEIIEAYRRYGFLGVDFNPIPRTEHVEEDLLSCKKFQARENEQFETQGLLAEDKAPLHEIVSALKAIYAGRIGIEYASAPSDVAHWIQERFEPLCGRIPLGKEQKKAIVQQLIVSDLLETYLHTKFVGEKRFSLEGAETLIPMLQTLVQRGVQTGVEEIVFGMSHRGRLNVLANIFAKPLLDIYSEFDGGQFDTIEGSGDVKYHKGYESNVHMPSEQTVQLTMSSNPSHLESVDPVVQGLVAAKQRLIRDFAQEKVIPVLIHGDGAISGQGVVYETLQMSRLKGYTTGGTIHFVINNHIGFTTLPEDSRSTKFCTDIAKAFGYVVFHVNAEDPESCVWATISALELRQQFHTDVLIDLNCYRKYGHNESDEPAYTQPLLYENIRKRKSIREQFVEKMIQEGAIDQPFVDHLVSSFRAELERVFGEYQKQQERKQEKNLVEGLQASLKQHQDLFAPVPTQIGEIDLIELGRKLVEVPANFTIHPRLLKQLEAKKIDLEAKKASALIDWAHAEMLSIGSCIQEQIPVRITGQDVRRGTFSQRHAMWVDQKTEWRYFPHQSISSDKQAFCIYDSPLSEFAALGFEYGYSVTRNRCLVIWEAQFGDFANGAQVIIDQYIAAGESKWGNESSLVMLLPHGFEGHGPEHSSARMERFLQLAAEENMRIVSPSSPKQLFHLIRRQAKMAVKKPLIVFTPKGLLRHPLCVSTLAELATGSFEEIIDDHPQMKKARRLIFCQGKIYYELIQMREKLQDDQVAIIRIEQLYPFHGELFSKIVKSYGMCQDFLWVQEEPYNAGAYSYIREYIEECLPKGSNLVYVGRKKTASPATGSHEVHQQEMRFIIEGAFGK